MTSYKRPIPIYSTETAFGTGKSVTHNSQREL